ncbi:MAG: glycosyltransferase family 2 protein [Candidatus Berkelbacteria bacterium]
MTKISIITPSFNQANFIGRTMSSVLEQRGDFFLEYFVMDGGSTDKTVEVIKKFEQRIKDGKYGKNINFYWQSKKDNGQSDAINQGLKKSTGDIIAYMNSDDSYVDGIFQEVVSAFEKNDKKNWLTGYCNIIDADDKPIRSIIANYKNFWLRHYSFSRLLILNFVSQPATFWKSSVVKKFGLFDENLHYTMDYDYWLRIGKNNDPIILKQSVCNFRIHGQSKGETAFKKQFAQDFQVATAHSTSDWLTFLHKIHNFFIICVYKILK